MMLGLLLARVGVETLVLEKHADFLRDFRGDTIHPSTLEVMHELGLLEEFLRRPHQKVTRIGAQIGAEKVQIADFTHLPTRCRFMALMPQWDFLDFLADQAERHASFRLLRSSEVVDLVPDGDRVAGVTAHTAEGDIEVRADLVVGADGRRSTVREHAGLAVRTLGAPMDVFWIRLSRDPSDPAETFGHIEAGRLFVMIERGDYWQCAFVFPKGGADAIRSRGLANFRDEVLALSPWLGSRVEELRTWDDVKLLTVSVDRLERWWKPGLLCIGDAAHAMSPIGGVGINLAIQDAVAAGNILSRPLTVGAPSPELLKAVQERREWPARVTQRLQLFIQDNVVSRVLAADSRPRPPFLVRLLDRFPYLRRYPARLVGIGVRPEHVRPIGA